jgi:hypothetical protein
MNPNLQEFENKVLRIIFWHEETEVSEQFRIRQYRELNDLHRAQRFFGWWNQGNYDRLNI